MAKKKLPINLAGTAEARSSDLQKLFTAGEDVERSAGLQLLALRLDAIQPDPNQPRTTFNDGALQELSDSIRQDGVIQPIEVVEVESNRYLLVHGERRWRAAQQAGLETIPAIVRRRDYDALTRFVRQLVENIQREDLNDVDRAKGLVHLKQLMEEEAAVTPSVSSRKTWKNQVTWPQVGERLGYSRQRIGQLVQLLKLPADIQEDVRQGKLSERDSRILQGLEPAQQRELHAAYTSGEMNRPTLEQTARRLKNKPATPTTRSKSSDEPLFDILFDDAQPDSAALYQENAAHIAQAEHHLLALDWQELAAAERKALAADLNHLHQQLTILIKAISA
jgi:ParB family transcriptional regulator, chromosome partitioning protein